MNRKWKRFLLAGITMLLSFMQPISVRAGEKLVTKDYHVEVTVHKDQSYDIVEKIRVDFPESRHGIYRSIPFRGTVRSIVDGKEQCYAAKVKGISVKNEPYKLSTSNAEKKLKIGDKSQTVTGVHSYEISYTYVMCNDNEKNGYDELSLNVIPSNWKSDIESATVVVHMPAEFDSSHMDVYAGTDEKEQIDYSIQGNDIHITTKNMIPRETGITLRVKLPETYFTNVPSIKGYAFYADIYAVICGVMFLIIGFRYVRKCKVIRCEGYNVPEEISPGGVGCILNRCIIKEHMLSLILFFAFKGYLKMEKGEEGEIYLKREKGEEGEIYLKRKKKFSKRLPNYQKTFYAGLFQYADKKGCVPVRSIPPDFFFLYRRSALQLWQNYMYKQAVFDKRKEKVRSITNYILWSLLIVGGFLFALETGTYEMVIFFVIPFAAYMWVLSAGEKYWTMWYACSRWTRIRQEAVLALEVFVAVFLEIQMIYVCTREYSVEQMIYALVSAIGFWVIFHFNDRTEYGNQLVGKILGFRDSIVKEKKEGVSGTTEERTACFYEVIPYAYALGVTKQWMKKFDGMPLNPPVWYDDCKRRESQKVYTASMFLEELEVWDKELSAYIYDYDPSAKKSSTGPEYVETWDSDSDWDGDDGDDGTW